MNAEHNDPFGPPDYEDPWDDSLDDYEDDDPYGCCCPGECLNPHWHHRLSECFTYDDVREPSRWLDFWWWLRDRAISLVTSFRRRPEEEEDDLPF